MMDDDNSIASEILESQPQEQQTREESHRTLCECGCGGLTSGDKRNGKYPEYICGRV